LPVFLKLLEGKSEEEHPRVARRSCFYAMLLAFFFLFFGKFILWIFGVPLSMVRIVGGIILMRIGFDLFSPSSTNASIASAGGGSTQEEGDVSFVPLAMPIMFGPGAIATVLGMVFARQTIPIRNSLRDRHVCGHRGDDVRDLPMPGLC